MIACIDVGLKRIGIALGYKNGVIIPINAVLRQNRNQAAKDVKHILDEWNVKKLVVGIPLGGSSEDEMRRRISHFVNLLDFNGEIVFFDESFSSVEAGEFGVANHKKKDGKLDSLSAMVILQRYFDSLK
ncbi:Holliday junction resolvase RuvX [Campylobacter ureolyticus]|uniref:Holliday junction resolvase RuvX n=1 Tax=Campylobacter ureolyticus TaxID=827 RepID=UPI0029097255|nr:Holliday junction resolvase RuvX [Campylobacter ureolyticus]MDU5326352.1 Holliday junction resolvase RuvX [Campylobacter ureolyticus]